MEMVVIIRPSFKKMCGNDACRAALFNHLLYWIAQKAKGQAQAKVKSGGVSWYGTAEEICTGMDESWSVNKVRKEIKLLVDSALMGQCRNPNHGWDQTRHYFIGEEQGQAIREACQEHGICLLHLGLRPDVLHLLNLVNAIDKSVKCNCQKEEMQTPNMVDGNDKSGNSNSQISENETPDMVNRSTKNGNAIPKVTTKATTEVSSKETKKEAPDVVEASSTSPAPEPISLSLSSKKSVEEDDLSLVPAIFLKPELRAAR